MDFHIGQCWYTIETGQDIYISLIYHLLHKLQEMLSKTKRLHKGSNCFCIFHKKRWNNVLDLSMWVDFKLIFIYISNPVSGEDIFLSPRFYFRVITLWITETVY